MPIERPGMSTLGPSSKMRNSFRGAPFGTDKRLLRVDNVAGLVDRQHELELSQPAMAIPTATTHAMPLIRYPPLPVTV